MDRVTCDMWRWYPQPIGKSRQPGPSASNTMSSTSTSSTQTARPIPVQPPSDSTSRIPVTPAVLRSIFASSRTPHEERSISRVAFFRYTLIFHIRMASHQHLNRFTGFLLSCIVIGLAAARGRGIKSGAALLGVV